LLLLVPVHGIDHQYFLSKLKPFDKRIIELAFYKKMNLETTLKSAIIYICVFLAASLVFVSISSSNDSTLKAQNGKSDIANVSIDENSDKVGEFLKIAYPFVAKSELSPQIISGLFENRIFLSLKNGLMTYLTRSFLCSYRC
jgi:hypothetical protein